MNIKEKYEAEMTILVLERQKLDEEFTELAMLEKLYDYKSVSDAWKERNDKLRKKLGLIPKKRKITE